MTDLHLTLDRSAGVRTGLERALREAITAMPPGTRLPSSRALAIDLGVARNTVAEVYSQLVQEGRLEGDRGAGTRVAAVQPQPAQMSPSSLQPEVAHDLRAGRPDVSFFPAAAWNAATRQVLNTRPREALQYDEAQGSRYAREVLAGYLNRVRGVQADPDRILLCSGLRQAVALVAGALHRQGARSFGYERPGQPAIRQQLSWVGLDPRPLPIDSHGAVVGQLGDEAGAVLTPAHQFPTGVPLAPRRRTEVIAWARRTGGVIVEDDYDGEFRYDRQPIERCRGWGPTSSRTPVRRARRSRPACVSAGSSCRATSSTPWSPRKNSPTATATAWPS
ncbi:PLP-dependent aminotransferase family protein [Kribbella sp. NPDC023855]|uniref:aminotransferase-like domain-containing protein n=1 Tax=Kribbella sp. NPDC023855 TaxID=3154698 RepID=UPI0034011EF8